MALDLRNRRQLLGLTLAAVAVTAIASVGFASLSENPLVPDAEFAAGDAAGEYDLSEPGTVDMLVVTHRDGEAVDPATLELVLGSRASGVAFNESGNWTVAVGDLEYELALDGGDIAAGDRVEEGDRLVVSKTSGTVDSTNGTFDVRARLVHRPSQSTVLDETVGVR